MAYIGHRCTRCHHIDVRHHEAKHGCSGCRTSCAELAPGPSELIPTWGLNGQPVTTITKPGDKLGFAGATTCGKDCCQTAHKEMTAA